MKIFIAVLLQYPTFVVLTLGLKVITGLSSWWCLLIAVMLLVSYNKGSEMTRGV